MSARSFKSVGWVASVGAAALGCYMLSLQVAAERAELASVERRIVAAQQEIRGLQTELGTRGRLQQLEQWNTDVLALASPASGQFVENEVVLARFETPQSDALPGAATVQMASAETTAAPAASRAAPVAPAEDRPQVRTAVAEAPADTGRPVVRRASMTTTPTPAPAPAAARIAAPRPAARPAAASAKTPAPARSASLLDERTTRAIGEAARSETRTARPAAATPRPAAPARTTPARRTAETASRTQAKN